jgi:hypothetical protein
MRGDFYYTASARAPFALTVLALLANIVYGNQFMDTFQVKICAPHFPDSVFASVCSKLDLLQSCSQSFNGGFSYDLTPLVRTAGLCILSFFTLL